MPHGHTGKSLTGVAGEFFRVPNPPRPVPNEMSLNPGRTWDMFRYWMLNKDCFTFLFLYLNHLKGHFTRFEFGFYSNSLPINSFLWAFLFLDWVIWSYLDAPSQNGNILNQIKTWRCVTTPKKTMAILRANY